jgi:hypothetical protein
LGLVFALVALPVAVSGPDAAIAQARTFVDVTVRPGLNNSANDSRAAELTDVTGTDSQSILCVLHNLRFANPWARTSKVAPWTRAAHWAIAGLLTAVTLIVHGRRSPSPRNEVAFIGALATVMSVITPINHLHYFVFALPLATALWAKPSRQVPREALASFFVANVASMLPILALRMYGLTTVAALLLWAVALVPDRSEAAGLQQSGEPPTRDAYLPQPHAA